MRRRVSRRRRRGRAARSRREARHARRPRSRSSATARAACSGWSRWSKWRRRRAASPMGRSTPSDVAGLFDAGFLQGGRACAAPRPTEEIPYLKNQERLTFARCGIIDPLSLDDYVAHGGFAGLPTALAMEPARDRRRQVTESGPARPRRRRLPDRHQVEDGAEAPRPTRNTSSATPTRATAAPSPTAC